MTLATGATAGGGLVLLAAGAFAGGELITPGVLVPLATGASAGGGLFCVLVLLAAGPSPVVS